MRSRTRRAEVLGSLSLVGLIGLPGAATAVTAVDLRRCAEIAEDRGRLACYDGLAGRPSPAAQTSQPVVSNVEPIPPVPGGDIRRFGLVKPEVATPQVPQSISARVDRIKTDGVNEVQVQLDNGQTWTFADANFLLRQGDAVVIKRAALGSYIMIAPTRRSYRVRRIK